MALPVDLGTFDPGQGQDDSWDNIPETKTEKAKRVAAQAALEFNPLMALRTLQDAPAIAWNATVAPLASMWSVPGQAIQNKGAELIYGALGEEDLAREARDRGNNIQPADMSLPVRSASGQAAQEAIADAFKASKLEGALGLHMPASRGFSPNDLRAAAGEVQNFGKQVREIPTDFANAKAGTTKIDPITGKPTLGSGLYDIAPGLDTIGEVGPSSGSRAAQFGAVRMPGTQIARARDPGTGNLVTPAQAEYADLSQIDKLQLAPEHSIDKTQMSRSVLGDYTDRYLQNNELRNGLQNYFDSRLAAEYPDAPSKRSAQLAFEARHGGRSSQSYADAKAEMIDDFVKTPEAQQLAQAQGQFLPTVEDYFNRHDAAMKWISNNLSNYASKFVGTSNDPLLKAASEGYTFLPANEIRQLGNSAESYAESNRRAAGMPGSALQDAIDTKQAELDKATQDLTTLAESNAGNLEATNTVTRAQEKRKKIAQELENLKLGAAYENLADAGVQPTTKEKLLNYLDYNERQFYPDVTHPNVPSDATVYRATREFNETGLKNIARSAYNDVMQGKLSPDNLSANLPVDKYVRQKSAARMQEEANAAAARATYVNDASKAIAARNAADPAGQVIGNTLVLETDANTPHDVALQRASDATAVLDHCVGQGGRDVTYTKEKHPFTGNTAVYEPLRNPITGEANPNAGRQGSGYVDTALNGSGMLTHINDAETKLPVATLQLHKDHNGYSLGYVSGPTTSRNETNGPIDPKYHQAIADYLNKRGDITHAGSNISDNTSILDLQEDRAAARILGVPRPSDISAAHPDLPRFMTEDALKEYTAGVAAQKTAAQQNFLPTSSNTDTIESLQQALNDAYVEHGSARRDNDLDAAENAISRINDLEARIGRARNDQRLAANHANPAEYLYNDFAPLGEALFLTSQQMRNGQAAIDAIHAYFDENRLQDNSLYAGQALGHPAIDEVLHDNEAQRILSGLSHDTRNAVGQYFRDLPDNDRMAMPRVIARMSDPELYSQISNAQIARLPEIFAQLGQFFDANPQHFPSILAFADEMRHDRPMPMPMPGQSQQSYDPAQLELALRLLTNERLAQGQIAARAARAAPAAQPEAALGGDWEVDTTHPANQTAAQQEADLSARMARLRNGDFAQQVATNQAAGTGLIGARYDELQQNITNTQRHLVNVAVERIANQAQAHGIDSPAEVAGLIRRRNNVFGSATVPLTDFTPSMVELLARDVSDTIEARNNAVARTQQQQLEAPPQEAAAPRGWNTVEPEPHVQQARDLAQHLENQFYDNLRADSSDRLNAITHDIDRLSGDTRRGAWRNLFGGLPVDAQHMYSDELANGVIRQLRELQDRELMSLGQYIMNMIDESLIGNSEGTHARRIIDDTITQLENRGEQGWEDVLGAEAQEYEYSPSLRDAVLREMRILRTAYE